MKSYMVSHSPELTADSSFSVLFIGHEISVCSSKSCSSHPFQTWQLYCLGPNYIFGSVCQSVMAPCCLSLGIITESKWMVSSLGCLCCTGGRFELRRVEQQPHVLRWRVLVCLMFPCLFCVSAFHLSVFLLSDELLFCFLFYFDRSLSHLSCLDLTSCFWCFRASSLTVFTCGELFLLSLINQLIEG